MHPSVYEHAERQGVVAGDPCTVRVTTQPVGGYLCQHGQSFPNKMYASKMLRFLRTPVYYDDELITQNNPRDFSIHSQILDNRHTLHMFLNYGDAYYGASMLKLIYRDGEFGRVRHSAHSYAKYDYGIRAAAPGDVDSYGRRITRKYQIHGYLEMARHMDYTAHYNVEAINPPLQTAKRNQLEGLFRNGVSDAKKRLTELGWLIIGTTHLDDIRIHSPQRSLATTTAEAYSYGEPLTDLRDYVWPIVPPEARLGTRNSLHEALLEHTHYIPVADAALNIAIVDAVRCWDEGGETKELHPTTDPNYLACPDNIVADVRIHSYPYLVSGDVPNPQTVSKLTLPMRKWGLLDPAMKDIVVQARGADDNDHDTTIYGRPPEQGDIRCTKVAER